jgi:hypothetical protein
LLRLDRRRPVCFYTDVESGSVIINNQDLLSAEDEARLEATLLRIAESHGYVSNLMQTVPWR